MSTEEAATGGESQSGAETTTPTQPENSVSTTLTPDEECPTLEIDPGAIITEPKHPLNISILPSEESQFRTNFTNLTKTVRAILTSQTCGCSGFLTNLYKIQIIAKDAIEQKQDCLQKKFTLIKDPEKNDTIRIEIDNEATKAKKKIDNYVNRQRNSFYALDVSLRNDKLLNDINAMVEKAQTNQTRFAQCLAQIGREIPEQLNSLYAAFEEFVKRTELNIYQYDSNKKAVTCKDC